MSTVPIIPESAPFTAEQRSWLNGFLAGILSKGEAPSSDAGTAAPAKPRLLIAFGSQSGNAESLSKRLSKQANGLGFNARAAGLDSLKPADLLAEKNVLIITSTWGEGDMPDNAISFWDGLNQNGSSPRLAGIRFSILALGDKNYGDTFCLAGRKLDERFAELGATRIHPRVECDVEFDELAKTWSEAVFKSLQSGNETSSIDLTSAQTSAVEILAELIETGYSRKNPYPAALLANHKLNTEESAKDTRHIAFSLEGSGLVYETGDALGVMAQNCAEVIDQILVSHQLDGSAMVPLPDGGEAPLRDALLKNYEVRNLHGKTPLAFVTPAEFVASLRKLQPRLYSIASSPKAHPGEVHLTVGAVRYTVENLAHKGVASTYMADRLSPGDTAGVFIHSAKHFRVPADESRPMIMIGPGTGIAPFRAFIEEREATKASGKNWLFFGDQRSSSDYLYREQIETWHQNGVLTRLSLAFSRDQPEKIYVQTRMLEHAAELWQWLEEGAHFYVCGDASRMAKDVDAALHLIIQQQGNRSADEAVAYVTELKKVKRYARDVY